MKVLGISGSLRRDSHNTNLLRAAAELVDGAVEFELWEGLKAVPPYDEDADAILFATPEYNSSIPGQLKNALDWVSRPVATNPLRNKPVAVVGASTGAFGAVWSQAELRKVLGAIGARVLDCEVACRNAAASFDEHGRLIEDEARRQLGETVDRLLEAARAREEARLTARVAA
jgi:chromate reductase